MITSLYNVRILSQELLLHKSAQGHQHEQKSAKMFAILSKSA